MRLGMVGLVLGMMACAGSEPVETDPPPVEEPPEACIEMDTSVPFGEVLVPGSETRSVTILSACVGTLEVESVLVDPGPSGGQAYAVEVEVPFSLAQGESRSIDVAFTPDQPGEIKANLAVVSNDPNRPRSTTELVGVGSAPRLTLSPENYDYGSPYVGCEQGGLLDLQNTGNLPLVVNSVEGLTSSLREFSVDLDPFTNGELPFTIRPGTSVSVYMDYLPLDTSSDKAFMVVRSNDPFQVEHVATFTGTGTEFGQGVDEFEVPLQDEADVLITLDRPDPKDTAAIASYRKNLEVIARDLGTLPGSVHVLLVVADDGCPAGSSSYIDNGMSESDAVAGMLAMADLERKTVPTSKLETAGLDLAEAALSAKNLAGCNAGYFRATADLSTVHITDSESKSVDKWSAYVSRLQALKTDPDRVRMHAIAGDYPSGCGSAAAGVGYYEATVATGGLFRSVCLSDWGVDLLEDIEPVRPINAYELKRQPIPQSIEVRVDGVLVGGWDYYISANSVVFHPGSEPPRGSALQVTYDLLPNCEG